MSLNNKKIYSENIFGICSYPIYGGGVIIFMDLIRHFGIDRYFLNESILKNGHDFSGANYLPVYSLSKSPTTWLRFLVSYFQIFLSVYRKTKDCKIVIVNDFVALLYVLPRKLLKETRVYYFCHGAFRNAWFNRNILSRFINLCSEVIVVPSHFLERDLVSMGIKSNKIHCIYNGIDEPTVSAPRQDLHHKNRLQIGIIGIIQDLKGQDVFIDAVLNLNRNGHQVTGNIVGPIGEDNFYKKIKDKTANQKPAKAINFVGPLNHPSALEFINSQDVIVSASKYMESLGIVLLEAMALKKPVIGTKVGGIPEVIENERNGFLIDPCNRGQLEESILKLMDKCKRQQMGEAGYQIFREKFTKETFGQQHHLLIERLMKL